MVRAWAFSTAAIGIVFFIQAIRWFGNGAWRTLASLTFFYFAYNLFFLTLILVRDED